MIAEIIGAFAMVVSVVYLAVQISDNSRTLKNQGHFNALSLARRPLELVIADPDLPDIIERGYETGSSTLLGRV